MYLWIKIDIDHQKKNYAKNQDRLWENKLHRKEANEMRPVATAIQRMQALLRMNGQKAIPMNSFGPKND